LSEDGLRTRIQQRKSGSKGKEIEVSIAIQELIYNSRSIFSLSIRLKNRR